MYTRQANTNQLDQKGCEKVANKQMRKMRKISTYMTFSPFFISLGHKNNSVSRCKSNNGIWLDFSGLRWKRKCDYFGLLRWKRKCDNLKKLLHCKLTWIHLYQFDFEPNYICTEPQSDNINEAFSKPLLCSWGFSAMPWL